jgi:hypothetical protein
MRYIHLLGETAKELDELLGALLFIERLRRSLLCEEFARYCNSWGGY